jgi:hypothetical protein
VNKDESEKVQPGDKEKEKDKEGEKKQPKATIHDDPENFNPFQRSIAPFFCSPAISLQHQLISYFQDGNDSSSDDEDDNTVKKKIQITIKAKTEAEAAPPVTDDVLMNSMKGFTISSFDDKKR